MKLIYFAASIFTAFSVSAQTREESRDCVPIDHPGFVIKKPGNYCFTKNIRTRLDFADHSAEKAVVEIQSNNVVIDMKGYYGARAIGPFQKGGNGFYMSNMDSAEKINNVIIKNGTLINFNYGIFFYNNSFKKKSTLKNLQDFEGGVLYHKENIKITNVKFIDCNQNYHFMDD